MTFDPHMILQSNRILLVDDHPVVRAGLAITLGKEPGFIVCGEAADVREAMAMIKERNPDLILVDLDLEESSGFDLIREVKEFHPGIPVLVLSMHDEVVYAERALRAGARGYLMKNQPAGHLVTGIREVLAGGIAVSENMKTMVVNRLVQGAAGDAGDSLKVLSDRELEVFRQIGMGMTTRKIAEKLCLSVKTVETHVAHIKRKLRLTTAVEVQHRAFHWTQGHSQG